ncbi:MAG TPA: DUF421 domain-containing protein [Bacilli bacterium]
MDLHFVWKAVVIVIGGVLILRLAGRKSISQLTVAQTVMMVAVGSLIIQPVNDRNIWITMLTTFLLVVTLICIEYIILKYDTLERFFYGRSVIVVEKGQINDKNLAKLRLTVDMLEVRIRQNGIEKISDLQWATVESNGHLGYLLKPDKQYATKEDIQMLKSLIQAGLPNAPIQTPVTPTSRTDNIFTEIHHNKHREEPPKHLR